MNKNPYKNFPNYVLRTPLFPIDFYKNLSEGDHISEVKMKELFDDPVIKEAVFLASPPLYEELDRWTKGEVKAGKKIEKLKYSFLKYLSRMASRCTPFGLFAGCCVGEFGENTHIKLKEPQNNLRHTRLDMNYLVALSQDLVKNKNIREQLLFYPNSSIYKAGDQFRYVEYKYIDSKRHHHIVAVDDSEYLSGVLEKSAKGNLLKNLAETLVNEDISFEEAAAFIEELVESQLLISELEPSVSGPEFLGQIQAILQKLNGTENILKVLDEADKQIRELDKRLGNLPVTYIELSEFLKELETGFELKYLFQTDMVLETEKNILNQSVVDHVKKGVTFLNRITLPPKSTLLDQFKTAFYERFEEREVPMSKALDVEMGIGYKQDQGAGDVSPLVDDLVIPGKKSEYEVSEIRWSPVHAIFQKKLVQALTEKDYCIDLQDEDFKDFEENWDDLPDTISTMIEIVEEADGEKIKFGHAGGSSAANLLGRFCHGDNQLYNYTKQIIDAEKQANHDKILAEVVHLPESRVGNILMRPVFRDYEIPYLAKSVLPKEGQLPIDDLHISVKSGRQIKLRSEKLDKEIVPHHTNAYNYSANSLPIYHFLCDMQTQGLREGVGFNLGPFAAEYAFIPRIAYKNLILQEATWHLKKEDITPLIDKVKNDDALKKAVKTFREKRKIPHYVMLTDGDNELLINFENLTTVRMLLETVKNRPGFKLTEFLFGKSGIVKGKGKKTYYANQIVLSFYNTESPKNE